MQNELEPSSLKRVRLAIFAFYFCQGLCFSSWASRIADIKTSLGLNDAAWGTILLMIPIGQVCGMTISGLIVSKVGSKRIFPIAIACYTLVLLLIGLATSEYALIMSLIVFGFFGNFSNISVNTQGTTVERMYNRSIMASFHGGWSLAGLVGAAIGLSMTTIGIRPFYHFCIVAAINLTLFLINYKYLQPDIKRQKDPAEIAERKKNKPETFLFLIGFVAFFGMAAEGAMSDWSGLYLMDVVGIAEKYAPLGLLAYMITMTSGRFVVDRAIQRWGRLRVIQCGGLLIFCGLTLAVTVPNIVAVVIAFMIIGLGTSSIAPTIYSIAGQKTKIPTSIALTIVSSISFLGFLLGPPIIGYISHATNLRVSYALIGLFGLCIVILASKIKVLRETTLTNEEDK